MRLGWTSTVVVCLLAGGSVAACTAASSKNKTEGSGSGAASSSGSGSNGSNSSSDGSGGFTTATSSGTGAGGEEACVAQNVEAQPKLQDADIIFAIDTSGSMGEESAFVREAMNTFSQQIVDSGIDVRVVMLAETPPPIPCFGGICPPGICIEPPLGSGGCPDDQNPPMGYYHPASDIKSNDSLNQIVALFPSYESVLRETANTYVVIVTDDDAAYQDAPPEHLDNGQEFLDAFVPLAPTKLAGVTVHGIYCFNDSGACVRKGTAYEDLINITGGIHGNLANQEFGPIFDDIAQQVIVSAGELPCQYTIPAPPEGEVLDPNEVNVLFTDGSASETDIYQVASQSQCNQTEGGWYYDDPNNPSTIHLCPASCDLVAADPQGAIDILFGCATIVADPD